MFSQHEISMEEHTAWFKRMQADPSVKWFLYLNKSGSPEGVVYFTSLHEVNRSGFWGFYTSPNASPGTGLRISLDALEIAFVEMGLFKLNVEVLGNNQRSLRMHKNVGFVEEGKFREQFLSNNEYLDVIRFGMLSREWPEHRAILQARVAELDALAMKRHSTAPPPPKFRIVLLSDINSWINPYIQDLVIDWGEIGYNIHWAHDTKNLPAADFCFCLSFGQILPEEVRQKFKHTLVVHESDLPRGKGWSPLTWQILEGRNRIPVTLFEAAERVDSGPIYAQHWIEFKGNELIDELRTEQAKATNMLCHWFINHYPESTQQARDQIGEESFYRRRRPQDSVLDPNKTIAEQFNLLRVADNERYPAWFTIDDLHFKIKIIKKGGDHQI
jgi:UDP-4-amino-4,6-dideoxy-N-acetyl-beta-L-altrosamine N-acetyltransferase